MKNATNYRSLLFLTVLLTATLFSCKSKETTTDGTSADTTMVDTSSMPATDMPADTTAVPVPSDTIGTPQ